LVAIAPRLIIVQQVRQFLCDVLTARATIKRAIKGPSVQRLSSTSPSAAARNSKNGIDAKAARRVRGTVKALRDTEVGKEATMYTALRDLFVDLLGYPKINVVTDIAGKRGRPDLTVYAPGGTAGSRIAWIVIEAKDEKGAVSDQTQRLKLYAEKAKYITADTAYIVMVDPVMLVARGAGIGKQADAISKSPGTALRRSGSWNWWPRCTSRWRAFRSYWSFSEAATRA
jgi:hypothetical protein